MSNLKERLQRIKDEVAKEHSFDDWDDLCFCHGEMTSINRFDELNKFIDMSMKRYAEEVIKEASESIDFQNCYECGNY